MLGHGCRSVAPLTGAGEAENLGSAANSRETALATSRCLGWACKTESCHQGSLS